MKKILSASIGFLLGISAVWADCRIELNILPASGKDIPQATAEALTTRLTSAAVSSGAVSANSGSPFYLTARFDHLNTGTLPGPPRQHTLTTELTLLIGNAETQTVIASKTLTLKGAGTSEQKALQNALRIVNGNNASIRDFIAGGRQQVVDYYDAHAPQLMVQAEKAADTGEYGKALFLLTQIPECSSAYSTTLPWVRKYYSLYADREGELLLKQARMAWSTDQTPAGASDAAEILATIPVDSRYAKEADKLFDEITAQLKDDHRFETRQKYADSLDLEKRSIEAAKQVGTAWGNGQKSNTTIIPGL